MSHNMYAKPFTKVLGLVGFRVTSKNIGIGHSERNWNDYKRVRCGQRSRLQSESPENQDILYGAAKIHRNSLMGTRCVYSWTDIMVDMGLDKNLHHHREPSHDSIFNVCIDDWHSDILITRY